MTWRRKPPVCDGCPLHKADGPVSLSHDGTRVGGDGPLDARVVIVGEAPSEDEVKMNTPFVGASGRVLNLALRLAGISRSSVYVTNVVRCQTKRKPTRFEIEFCTLRWLWPELAAIAPTTIIPLGETAWSVFSNDPRGIESWRGAMVTRDATCPTAEPSVKSWSTATLAPPPSWPTEPPPTPPPSPTPTDGTPSSELTEPSATAVPSADPPPDLASAQE